MDRILLWALQSPGQWRSISTGLSPDRHRRWPPDPSQRSGGCSQHPSRSGPSSWRGCNHHFHNNLADWRMAKPMDPVLSHHTSQERQPAAVPELLNNKPHQSPKQSHAEDHTEQIEAQMEKIIAKEQAGFRAGKSTTEQIFNLRILCEKYFQHKPCLHRLQEGLRQGSACSFVGNHEEVQHQHKPYPSHQKPL